MNENNLPKTLRTHLDLWRSEKIIDEGTALKMAETSLKLLGEKGSQKTLWAKNGEGMMIGSFAIPVIAALIAAVISQSHLAVWRGWITFGFLSVCYFWWSVLGWISENHYSKKLIELASNSPRILLLILPVLIGSLWKSEVIFSPTLKRQTLGWIGGLISLPWILGLISVHTSEELGRTLTVVLCWSAQIGVSFLLIRDGLREYAKGWVNIGYLMLFISLVQRYFDLFEKFGFLKSGLGFILSGIFLLGLLFLMNRSRKSLFEKYAKESL